MRFAGLAGAIVLLLLLVAGAQAALSLTSISTVEVGVRAPPASFTLGANADKPRYVTNVAVTPNGTSFTAQITGRLGGDATVKDIVRLTSTVSDAKTITLRGTQVSNLNVPIHTWTVRSGGSTVVATLDMRAPNPAASFMLPAGATYELDMRVKVIRGVASSEATFSSSVWAVIG